MNMALADVTDSLPHTADHSKFPVAANVLSLQARRDLRRSVMTDNSEGLQTELRRDKKRLKLLLDLASDAVSNQKLHELAKAIMTRLKSATDSDGVCILLKRQEEGELDRFALDFRSKGSSLNERTVMPLAGTMASYVLSAGKPWAGTREQASASFPNELLLEEQFSTGCMLPLSGCNWVVGTLTLVRTRHNPYSQDELDFLTGVCSQIAVVLENALACQEIFELKDKVAQEKLYLEEEIRNEMNFDQIVGDSPALRQVLDLVQTVAPSDSTVLLLGETGTGKELIARAIHDHSRRENRTFVKLNCAAIPTGLFESELFGHEKGAFTGAISQKIGRLELADQGTLFLDEIGDVPLEIQPKLLRALQEREFERLGSTRTKKADLRLVAATNRNLEKMIADREFRSDLYYRLNVFPIRIPPLRERREDIPVLARYFTQKFAQQMEKRIETIPSAAMKALIEWDWPGNVRELGNFIERAVILTRGSSLEASLAGLQRVCHEEKTTMARSQPEDEVARIVKETLYALDSRKSVVDEHAQRQREQIVHALTDSKGRVAGADGAAARLGLNRTTLLSRMKKFSISAKQFC
ncbi:MAG TPA: sigma 54-interacting transcriptional regulator [Pyrinomonadaceae bacterium]|nr:sigma 54-interacting transcriptional regulator [Pyrinomonadaceae bacterium]